MARLVPNPIIIAVLISQSVFVDTGSFQEFSLTTWRRIPCPPDYIGLFFADNYVFWRGAASDSQVHCLRFPSRLIRGHNYSTSKSRVGLVQEYWIKETTEMVWTLNKRKCLRGDRRGGFGSSACCTRMKTLDFLQHPCKKLGAVACVCNLSSREAYGSLELPAQTVYLHPGAPGSMRDLVTKNKVEHDWGRHCLHMHERTYPSSCKYAQLHAHTRKKKKRSGVQWWGRSFHNIHEAHNISKKKMNKMA